MNPKLRPYLCFALVVILSAATFPISQLQAQATTILTLAVPNFDRDNYTENLLKDFEAANPGIKVRIVGAETQIAPAASSLDTHFSDLQKYTAVADVLYVDSGTLSVEGTRAGYFLDLSPLASGDTGLNTDDFYPAIWQAMQWDKGVWAIPTAANVYMMTYLPSAFDKAGLAYPSDMWTLDDLMNAVDKLTTKDANGKISQKGLTVFGSMAQASLFRSLIGENLFDEMQVPAQPQLDKPSVEALLEAWNKRVVDGYIGADPGSAPLSISMGNMMMFPNRGSSSNEQRVALLLPGGKGGLDVQGFAVSQGTLYPEKAYALAAYLSTRAEARSPFTVTSARKSLSGQSASTNNNGGPRPPNMTVNAETQAILDKAVANGLTLTDVRFVNYLTVALQKMQQENLDAKAALQAVELIVANNQKTASDKKSSLVVSVATPIPEITGKVTLKFGLQAQPGPQLNQDKWGKLAADFVAANPQIGRVNIETTMPQPQPSSMTGKYDCFYLFNNAVQDIDIKTLLNIDPYLASDSAFDKSNMVGNVMSQVTRDNKVWALPIVIEPSILRYDVDRFNKAGVQVPTSGWTVDTFVDALKKLKPSPSDDAPLIPVGTGGTHLLILIASYGGLPIDFRTDPPTFHYTEAANIDAIRQVLDLGKNGYIKYTRTSAGGFNFGGGIEDAIIYTASLNGFDFRPGGPGSSSTTAYNSVGYPKGTTYNGVSYTIGTAYISATTQNADACYRWISAVAQNPDLFNAMPAQKSLIDSSTQASDAKALYHQIADLLADPTTISIPSLQGARQSMFYQMWLFQAFDQYVLDNGDLDTALQDAQQKSVVMAECVAKLPPFDPSAVGTNNDYFRQYAACAAKADPSLASMFN
ncbi:MAG: hypothetical protein IT324_30670 [Anaerolineae bacterium]|nr:hypothetical protein [Anaerolineae bacterium]